MMNIWGLFVQVAIVRVEISCFILLWGIFNELKWHLKIGYKIELVKYDYYKGLQFIAGWCG